MMTHWEKAVLPFLVSFLLSVVVVTAWAGEEPTVLAPVTVVGTVTDPATGMSTLSAEDIQRLPQGDGSLNELLTVMPSVQTSEMSNTSLQGGEILPPNLSISGGRFYDNNFMIDGIGNNSLLDPSGDNPESVQDIPGYPQEMLLDVCLLDELTVYRFNIPAEFGGFTGGVVDAGTIDPGSEWSGKIDLKTTGDGWTQFHVGDEQQDAFENSNSAEQQPRFTKYNGGGLLNGPLTEGLGVLVSYRNLQSEIPLRQFGETRDQRRDLKTYFAKINYDLSSRTSAKLTYVQTPYAEERFREESQGSEIRDSWYTIDRSGYRVTGELSQLFNLGKLEVVAGYRSSENSRNAPPHFFIWNTRPTTWVGDWVKDWGTEKYSKEGGYGDLESTQQSETALASFTVEPFVTGPVAHEVKLGYGFERVAGTFERSDLTYNYSLAKTDSSVVCGDNDLDCIDGQQYMIFRNIYLPDSVEETINQHHLFIQDTLQYKRLTLRPGFRISRDDFLDNVDSDGRLAASYDLFGSGSTLLVGGINRYHGRSLLTYKLAEAKKPYLVQTRTKKTDGSNTLNDWLDKPRSVTDYTSYSELDTPYSDEWNAGFDQAIFGGRFKATYIERRNKDEFASETSDKDDEGRIFTTLNNNGRSKHEEVILEWERQWKNHYLAVNATWQKTKTYSNGQGDFDYRVAIEDEELLALVYFRGELMKQIDLPRADYNRAYVGNLIYSAALPYGFTFTNITRYRSGYEALEDSGDEQEGPDGEMIPIFARDKQPESWIFDWRLDWRKDLYRSHGIQLSLEINNVFNKKVPAGAEEEIQTYELGRQIWAGMEYYF